MNRRKFFGALGAAAAVVKFGGAAGATDEVRPKIGPLDVEAHRVHLNRTGETLHVYVNGKDVTRQCTFADDIKGVACVLKRNEDGRYFYDPRTGRAAKEVLRGHVVITPGPPL